MSFETQYTDQQIINSFMEKSFNCSNEELILSRIGDYPVLYYMTANWPIAMHYLNNSVLINISPRALNITQEFIQKIINLCIQKNISYTLCDIEDIAKARSDLLSFSSLPSNNSSNSP